MTRDKLKACPFCGGEANIVEQMNTPRDYGIMCMNEICDARIGRDRSLTYKEAIKAWNTRPEPKWPEKKKIYSTMGCSEMSRAEGYNEAVDDFLKAYKEARG